MNQPRVQPLNPPYAADIQAAFDRVMPPGMPPLKLFRSMAHNPRVLQRMLAGGLLDRGSIALRERELLILRATALCGAEYEWGVHVAAFAGKAGFSAAQIADTCSGRIDPALWSEAEQALGPKFDIKAFHDAVLKQGSVTLPVLEEQIRAFIAESKAGPGKAATAAP